MLTAMLRRTLACASLAMLFCSCSKSHTGPAGPGDGPKMCTQIGCLNGLQVELAKATPWAPGAYTFALALDGTAVTCTGALPLRPCDAGPSITCDIPDRVLIGESGCALAPDQHGFANIHVPSAVATFGLTITRDGEQLVATELTPTYVESQPNGPGCEPICHSASARVELP